MDKAFFLDRDGVLIVDKDYLSDPAQAELTPHAGEALRLIRKNGYKIVMVSNQSGIARGMFTFDDLRAVEQRIGELLAAEDASVDAWYYCPHHAAKGVIPEYTIECDCRKPKPGLLLRAAQELHIDCARSAMIGDKLSDLEAGRNAGCPWLGFVRTAKEDADPAAFPGVSVSANPAELVRTLLKRMEGAAFRDFDA